MPLKKVSYIRRALQDIMYSSNWNILNMEVHTRLDSKMKQIRQYKKEKDLCLIQALISHRYPHLATTLAKFQKSNW